MTKIESVQVFHNTQNFTMKNEILWFSFMSLQQLGIGFHYAQLCAFDTQIVVLNPFVYCLFKENRISSRFYFLCRFKKNKLTLISVHETVKYADELTIMVVLIY